MVFIVKVEIELELLLEYFWHGREYGAAGKTEPLYKLLQTAFEDDPGWKYRVYIQHETLDGLPLHVPLVWRYSNWKSTSDAHYKAKSDSEVRVQCHNLKQEQIGKIIAALQAKMFGALTPALANSMANEIYDKEDRLLAQAMGVKIEDIIWQGDLEQEVKTKIIPRLKEQGIL